MGVPRKIMRNKRDKRDKLAGRSACCLCGGAEFHPGEEGAVTGYRGGEMGSVEWSWSLGADWVRLVLAGGGDIFWV